MEELLQKILKIYSQFGIKSVTMDDLARELGISKKTLYVHFRDKEDVVDKTFLFQIQSHRCDMDFLEIKRKNAIDQLLDVSKFLISHTHKVHPSVNYDLMKYFPKTWEKVIAYRNDNISNRIKQNILKGIEEGLYRNDFNIEIIARLYVSRLELPVSSDLFRSSGTSVDDFFENLFVYHIRGIASKKGLEYLESKRNEAENI